MMERIPDLPDNVVGLAATTTGEEDLGRQITHNTMIGIVGYSGVTVFAERFLLFIRGAITIISLQVCNGRCTVARDEVSWINLTVFF